MVSQQVLAQHKVFWSFEYPLNLTSKASIGWVILHLTFFCFWMHVNKLYIQNLLEHIVKPFFFNLSILESRFDFLRGTPLQKG